MIDLVTTSAAAVISGGVGGLIALGLDNWRADSARKRAGREAIQEFQRVLGDFSTFKVLTAIDIDEHPLEKVAWEDIATARRAAYHYHDLLRAADRHLVTRNSVSFDRYDDDFIDARQPFIGTWAAELQTAIDRAFNRTFRR